MSLKRKTKISPTFSMASMTDIIFLLLIFFMITSTMISPNAIKVLLPQGSKQTTAKTISRVVIDKDLNIYAATGNDKEKKVTLSCIRRKTSDMKNFTTQQDHIINSNKWNHSLCILLPRHPSLNKDTGRKDMIITYTF